MCEKNGMPKWIEDLSELIRKKKEENEALKKVQEAFSESDAVNEAEKEQKDILKDNETKN